MKREKGKRKGKKRKRRRKKERNEKKYLKSRELVVTDIIKSFFFPILALPSVFYLALPNNENSKTL